MFIAIVATSGERYSTKIHVLCDSRGTLLGITMTGGQRHESTELEILIGRCELSLHRVAARPAAIAGDKGYHSADVPEAFEQHTTRRGYILESAHKHRRKRIGRESPSNKRSTAIAVARAVAKAGHYNAFAVNDSNETSLMPARQAERDAVVSGEKRRSKCDP